MPKELVQSIDKTPKRALLKALGLSDDELGKPLIAVLSAKSALVPSSAHLNDTLEAVKSGVYSAGGTPLVLPTGGLCEGLAAENASLPYREIIADSIECMLLGHEFDGVVLVPDDETAAGMLMGAVRVNIPTIMIGGGAARCGEYKGKKISHYSAYSGIGAVKGGSMTLDELADIENNACPQNGSTSSFSCIVEALGIAPFGNGTVLAMTADRQRLAKKAGAMIMKLVSNDIRPNLIMTKNAFINALCVNLAVGGSTNTLLHLFALADECGIKLDLSLVSQLSEKTPSLCNISPTSQCDLYSFGKAGGVAAVLSELANLGLISGSEHTVTNKTLDKSYKNVAILDYNIIRPAINPLFSNGGITVLKGNFCEDGAVIRSSCIGYDCPSFTGKAKVFDSEADALNAVVGGSIKKGDVLVIRYEGPVGGPGMRKLTAVPALLEGMGLLQDVAVVTDGRFSDEAQGLLISHVCPEAAVGGKIALIRDGDKIDIDLVKGKLNVDINAKETQMRTKKWKPQDATLGGYMLRYSYLVTGANTGATMKKKF